MHIETLDKKYLSARFLCMDTSIHEITTQVYHAIHRIDEPKIIIAYGNFGFNNKSAEYINDALEPLNQMCLENDVFIYFVRSCDDNPKLFNLQMISLSNIKTLPDVSLIKSRFGVNILCIGGNISFNRTWKKKHEELVSEVSPNTKLLFDNEGIDPSVIKDVQKLCDDNVPIHVIVSQLVPWGSITVTEDTSEISSESSIQYIDLSTPLMPTINSKDLHLKTEKWSDVDSALLDDIKAEAKMLECVLETLLPHKKKNSILAWFNGVYLNKKVGPAAYLNSSSNYSLKIGQLKRDLAEHFEYLNITNSVSTTYCKMDETGAFASIDETDLPAF